MRYLISVFRRPRNILFRPSAITVGWVLAQILEQYLRTGTVLGTCGDGVTRLVCP